MTDERFVISSDSNQNIYDIEKKCYYSSIDAMKLCDLLNGLYKENEQLKKQISSLKVELDTHKCPLWRTREAERKVSELTDLLSDERKKDVMLLNSLRKENMRLKDVQKYE